MAGFPGADRNLAKRTIPADVSVVSDKNRDALPINLRSESGKGREGLLLLILIMILVLWLTARVRHREE